MMPVLVEMVNGQYQATLLGAPGYSAHGATKAEAIQTLQTEINERTTRGELVWVDLPKMALSDLIGRYEPDPSLDEMVAEIYRERDAQFAREFPE